MIKDFQLAIDGVVTKLNEKQQKLFDKFESKEKLVVNGVDGFMKLLT